MLDCREYGSTPYQAIVLHGGPGAPGCCAAICRGLQDNFGVLEHLQTKRSTEELIQELREIMRRHNIETTVLIGHSWGAWLASLFAAENPECVSKLILVSFGPLQERYLPMLRAVRSKDAPSEAQIVDMVAAGVYDPGSKYDADHYCLIPNIVPDMLYFDEPQHLALMDELFALRTSGEILRRIGCVTCPVVVIHGETDPHPVDGVKEPLERALGSFKIRVLEKCGHDPWKEYYARDVFFQILRDEISTRA